MKKIFKSKKGIAFILALLLIAATCINSSDAFLWATGDGEAETEQVESGPAEEVVEINVEESAPVGSDGEVQQEAAEQVAGENEEQVSEEKIPEEETTEEVSEEETAEEALEEEDTEEIQEEVERSVEITSSLGASGTVEEGTALILTAHLTGYDDVDYKIQWQQSEDGENWEDIKGENDMEYTVILTKDKEGYLWRASVSTPES